MPGFTTHYLFGVDACRRLTSTSMHNMIRRDHSAYALGHGFLPPPSSPHTDNATAHWPPP